MKSYPLIAAKVAKEMWCITPEVFDAIRSALDGRASGMPMPIRELPDNDEAMQDGYSEGVSAVVPVFGILGKHLSQLEMMCGGCSYDLITAQLESAMNDPEISSVLIPFHSPGGMVMGMDECAAKIAEVRTVKPVIGFCDGICGSAAYRLAVECTAYYVTPSSISGSVGVYALLLDESERLAKEGVKVNPIVSGELKLAGASFKPLSEKERAYFQARVDRQGAEFRAAIKARRTVEDACLEGQTFTGLECVANGMADGLVQDLDECIEEIRKMTG